MSVRSERWQEEEVGGGVEGDLQEANMSLPRLVSRQTANIPPGERMGDNLSILSVPSHS